MAQYELAVLYHPDLEMDLEKGSNKVAKMIKESKGEIKNEDNWGKRKLTYKISGVEHAIYVFYTLEMPADGVKKLNDQLNITDEVIRFLVVKPDHKAIAKAEAQKAKQAARRNSDSSDSEEESSDSDEK